MLDQIVEFLNAVIGADSCFVYLLEEHDLVLRASKNPHPESVDNLRIPVGQGITGWVAEKREAVAIAQDAMRDSRFRVFTQLPEDGFQAIPLSTHPGGWAVDRSAQLAASGAP